MRAFLGIDLGTTGARALLCDEEGRVLGRGASGYPTHSPEPGWAEQDPSDWLGAVARAVGQALDGAGDVSVAAVGLSGQMHGTVLVDDRALPVGRAIIWSDRRSAAEAHELSSKGYGETSLQPIDSGYQASTLLWLSRNSPEALGLASFVLLPKDYLKLWLTSSPSTDPTDAASTGLFDTRRGQWSERVSELGLGREFFPEVVASGAVAGRLTPEVARALGLRVGTPVASGMGDTLAGGLGAGLSGKRAVAAISSGLTLLARSDRPERPDSSFHAFPFFDSWAVMGALLAGGDCLAWLARVLDSTPAELAHEAESSPAGARGATFLPHLRGERLAPEARGAFLGLAPEHSRADLARAVMEGVAFSLRGLLGRVGGDVRELVCAGGGASSDTWLQIIADAARLSASRAPELHSARGACILAARAVGAEPPPPEFGEPFEPHRTDEMERAYVRFSRAEEELCGS